MPVVLRPSVPSDSNYVASTIRLALLNQSAYFKGLHPATLDVLLEPLLATFETVVAADSSDPDTIVGFVVFRDPQTVAFVYVRERFRRRRIGDALLKRAGTQRGEVNCPLIVTSLDGQNFPRLADAKGYRCRFRPFMSLEIAAEIRYGRNAKPAKTDPGN